MLHHRLALAALAVAFGSACSSGPGPTSGTLTGAQEDGGDQSTDTQSDPDAGGVEADGSSAPTWSQIFALYLSGTTEGSGGTVGHCGACHGEVTSAPTAYAFLKSAGAIATLGKKPGSIFSWMGGAMPPGGATTDAKATADVEAWATAGAKND